MVSEEEKTSLYLMKDPKQHDDKKKKTNTYSKAIKSILLLTHK